MTIVKGSYEEGDITLRYPNAKEDVRYLEDQGMWFKDSTPKEVRDMLLRAKRQGFRVRLFYGDTTTGRSWLDEWDMAGKVGCSMGPLKVPLLIARESSHGGGAILDDCIIKIISMSTGTLYKHPLFHVPSMEIQKLDEPILDGNSAYANRLTHQVLVEGQVHAAFKSEIGAKNWIEYMKGNRQRNW